MVTMSGFCMCVRDSKPVRALHETTMLIVAPVLDQKCFYHITINLRPLVHHGIDFSYPHYSC